MNRTEKYLLQRTLKLGLLLTLLVVGFDSLGLLDPFERYLYDFRTRHFQHFTPPPTDKIVHLDIDDQSLAEIGWFPWPRTKLAEMIDEISRAGAKVIGTDIIFPEAQDPRIEKLADGSYQTISDDQNFAAAIARAGNVLIPVSVNLNERGAHSPLAEAIEQILAADLEADPSQVATKLRGTRFDSPGLPQQIKQYFFDARQRAAFKAVGKLFDAGQTDLDKITAQLAPHSYATNERTDVEILLAQTLPQVQSVRGLVRFTLPLTENLPPLLSADSELATIPALVEPAKFGGVVEHVRSHDGVVRTIPLFVNYRGRLMPHMALAAACAELGVNIADLRIAADSVTIPLHDSPPIVIPVRTIDSETYGKVGEFMDIPWFGASGPNSWLTMYDYPSHVESKQHVPLRTVWDICASLHDIDSNNRQTDEALFAVNALYPSDKAAAFLAKPVTNRDENERRQVVEATLKEMAELADIPSLEKAKPGELKEDDQKYLAAYQGLHRAGESNRQLATRIQNRRADLHDQLAGRYALIGWTATGKTDFYPTSLHATCPGSVIQGVVFNAIMTQHLWKTSPWLLGAFMTLVLGSLTTLCVATMRTIPALLCTLLLTCGYLFFNGYVLFDYGHYIVNAAGPLTAATVIWFGVTVARYIYEQRERSRITRRFSSYVDPMLVNFVVEHPEAARFDGLIKQMTVVFTDLAGFTSISEKLRERTVPLLNEYMSLMLPIIRENNGYWNKFLGDGIMFFFNAPADNPRHGRDAVLTVLQMQKAMADFNQRLFKRELPQVLMRAGIATGPMVVGDAGSTDPKHHASDYTVLGDEVNLGARLESANKALGSKVLMNAATADLLGEEFLVRPMGKLQVVGKTEGVSTFEALCLRSEASERDLALADLSKQIVRSFCGGDFNDCMTAAKKLEQSHGSSKFTQLYLRLSQELLLAPPGEGFSGQIILDAK